MSKFVHLLFGDSHASLGLRIVGMFVCLIVAYVLLTSSNLLGAIPLVMAMVLMFSRRSNFNVTLRGTREKKAPQ